MRPEDFREHIMTLAPGWDVFVGFEPDEPDRCVIVTPYGGDSTDNLLSRPGLQVIVRGDKTADSYAVAFNTLQAIHDDLANRTGTIGQSSYQSVYALQSPTHLEWDGNRRPKFVCNFSVVEDRP